MVASDTDYDRYPEYLERDVSPLELCGEWAAVTGILAALSTVSILTLRAAVRRVRR